MNSVAGCPTWKGGIKAPTACHSPSYQTCTCKWGAKWQHSTGRATPRSRATHSPPYPTRTRNTMCHLAGSAWNGGIALPDQPQPSGQTCPTKVGLLSGSMSPASRPPQPFGPTQAQVQVQCGRRHLEGRHHDPRRAVALHVEHDCALAGPCTHPHMRMVKAPSQTSQHDFYCHGGRAPSLHTQHTKGKARAWYMKEHTDTRHMLRHEVFPFGSLEKGMKQRQLVQLGYCPLFDASHRTHGRGRNTKMVGG